MQRVIVFANQKGGVAKTTTTLNLGVAFKEQGFRVLVVDLDPQGNLTMSQGMNPDAIERSMFDVLVHRLPISEIIHTAEVDVAVSSIDLAGAELALELDDRPRARAGEGARRGARHLRLHPDRHAALARPADDQRVRRGHGVIVPVQCEYLSLRGLVQLENTLAMVRENLNPEVKIEGILPTMFDGRTLHSREAVEILEESFGELVFKTRIRKTIRYAEAPVKGSSVLKYDPTGYGRRGLPRPGEGGARWREIARACVRAPSRSSSARPRPPSGRPRSSSSRRRRRRRRRHGRRPRSRRRRPSSTSRTSPQEAPLAAAPAPVPCSARACRR